MSGADELLAFVRAQLDDDERVARSASTFPYDHPSDAPWVRAAQIADSIKGSHAAAVHGHIARWDPARVLAEVEAKRRVLARYEDALSRQQDPEHSQIAAHVQAQEYEDWIIPAIAQPYAGRDGWREEWRAEG